MLECKKLVKDLTGYTWTLGNLKGISTDNFWTWLKTGGVGYDRDAYLGLDKCVNFMKEICF